MSSAANGSSTAGPGGTPKVSVVVPAYNSVAFIGATMDSILAQTFTDFELIVSDHSSTDGTWEVLQRYESDPRVRLSQLPKGGGAPANWTAVTEAARGEYVKLVCGDDLLYAESLAKQVVALDSHPGSVLAASTRDIVDARGKPLIKARGLPKLSGVVTGREAIRATVRSGTNIFGEPACVLMRRDLLMESGNWNGELGYLIDEASYVQVLLHGNLVAIKEPLAGFRVSDQQWSVALATSQASQAKAFHRRIASEHPGMLSQSDVRLGNLMASINAWGRRAAYMVLRRRMRAASHSG